MEKLSKKDIKINPYVMVIISFLVVILVGSILLVCPFTHRPGANAGSYIDALFTAVSATCVTGACTYVEGFANTLNFWGQLVTIIMIQIGGLGFITFLTFFFTLFNSKIQFKDRYLISQMVNSTNTADVVKFVRTLILITIAIEGLGFLLFLPVFLVMYKSNPLEAIWNALFHSISAFCNAGFDLFAGTTSLIGGLEGVGGEIAPDFLYYYFVTVAMILIVLGGLSYLVVIDIFTHKKARQWRAFTKIVLIMTAAILVLGTIGIYLTDGNYKDPSGMTPFQALFQAVTCRTAGFATYLQDDISWGGKLISCFLMLVGGSPLGTAGGIKTTTIFMVIIASFSLLKGSSTHAFKRRYSHDMAIKAFALLFLSLFIVLLGFILVYAFGYTSDLPEIKTSLQMATLYEVFSCFGTTGFFTEVEPYLSLGSKIVLCLLMFIGRLGPITFFQIFEKNLKKDDKSHFQYIEEDFLIG